MYKTEEFFNENGKTLKEVLKSCISDYYKHIKKINNDLHILETNANINTNNKKALSTRKENSNVH